MPQRAWEEGDTYCATGLSPVSETAKEGGWKCARLPCILSGVLHDMHAVESPYLWDIA